jgi:hypothetical protein
VGVMDVVIMQASTRIHSLINYPTLFVQDLWMQYLWTGLPIDHGI